MILVHRLTHPDHELYLNPDQILSLEATPDTVISLLNGTKFVVSESLGEVVGLVRDWRASILREVVPA
jgi:flagellar protein FlbD